MRLAIPGILASLLLCFSCGSNSRNDEQTEGTETEEIPIPFEEGGSQNAKDYFSGVHQQVKKADSKFRTIQSYDQIDASADSIKTQLDSLIVLIDRGKETLKLYGESSWPKREEFQEITLQWYDGLAALANDYYYELAEPMSRPDNTWTEEEQVLYQEYYTAYYEFFEVDQQWITFQEEFAAANNFTLEPDTTAME